MTNLCRIIVWRWWLSHSSPYSSRKTKNWKFQILKKSKGGTLLSIFFNMGNYMLKSPKTDFESKIFVSQFGCYDFSRIKLYLRNRLKQFPALPDQYFLRYRFLKLSIFTFLVIKTELQVGLIWNLHQSISRVKIRRIGYLVCQNWTKNFWIEKNVRCTPWYFFRFFKVDNKVFD